MFKYNQELLQSGFFYSVQETENLIQHLRNEDFKAAKKSLELGANPNFNDYDDFNIVSMVFQALWDSNSSEFGFSISSADMHNYYVDIEDEEEEDEENKNILKIKKRIYDDFKDFLKTWTEKGGDFNLHKDYIFENILISVKNKHSSFHNEYFFPTSDIINILNIINHDITPISLEPFYKNNQSVLGIMISEGWPYDQLNFVKLLNQKSPYFLLDKNGNTPLAYHLDFYNRTYYDKDNLKNYIEYTDTFIKDNFNTEVFFIKNKDNLNAIEYNLKNKNFLHTFILLNTALNMDIDIQSFKINAEQKKEILHSISNIKDNPNYNSKTYEFLSSYEKEYLQNSLNKELVVKNQNKKRI